MQITRREFVAITGVSMLSAVSTSFAMPDESTNLSNKGATVMYGLIGKIKAVPGQRDALIAILVTGVSGMPGCLSYIVAQDPIDADAIWVTEVWDSKESHNASLTLPSVQQAISLGRPLIAGFGDRFETTPVGGQGISAKLNSN
jgi:quinol monooxygenase YgiN